MSISGVSTNSYPSPLSSQNNFKQARTDLKTLASAVQSGDMASAQQALTSLQKDFPQWSAQANSSQSSPFNDLLTAVQSGDVDGAQKAFAALQQSKGHHGHHHAHAATSPTTPTTSSNTGDTDDGSSTSLLNVTA